MEKELFYGLSRVKAAQKDFNRKVRLLSRSWCWLKCITHLSGLILLVPIYFFLSNIERKILSRLLQLLFCKNNDLHYWCLNVTMLFTFHSFWFTGNGSLAADLADIYFSMMFSSPFPFKLQKNFYTSSDFASSILWNHFSTVGTQISCWKGSLSFSLLKSFLSLIYLNISYINSSMGKEVGMRVGKYYCNWDLLSE